MMLYVKDGEEEYLIRVSTIEGIRYVGGKVIILREGRPDLVIRENPELFKKIVNSQHFPKPIVL